MRRCPAVLPLALLLLPLAGCAGDGPLDPREPEARTLTVDASAGWVYLDLGTAATLTVAEPGSSTAWDVGFNATKVILNSGDNGPAEVLGYCVCQNAGATDEEVLAMTPESELADFEAVSASDVAPADDPSWVSHVFDAHRWYRYNITGNHQVSPTFQVYVIRRGDEVFKVQLVGYYSPAGEPRHVAVRYAALRP